MINVCYHGIGTPGRDLEPGEDLYWISPDQFLLSLDEICTWPDTTITFDDGNVSDLEFGVPALLERELTAGFFVVAGRIASPGSLDVAALRELRSCGMTVGTHGMAHRPWAGLDEHDLHTELVDARRRIEEVIGEPVQHAALPLGRYDRRVLHALHRCDYQRVYSSDRAPARPGAWLQPRYSITRNDTVDSLRTRIRDRQGLVHCAKGWVNQTRKRLR